MKSQPSLRGTWLVCCELQKKTESPDDTRTTKPRLDVVSGNEATTMILSIKNECFNQIFKTNVLIWQEKNWQVLLVCYEVKCRMDFEEESAGSCRCCLWIQPYPWIKPHCFDTRPNDLIFVDYLRNVNAVAVENTVYRNGLPF